VARARKKVKRHSKKKGKKNILKNFQASSGGLILVALFLGSTIAYAFLSGGSLAFGGDSVEGEPPENRRTAEALKNPYDVTQEFIDKGKDTYQQFCVGCHFEDGSGPPEHSPQEMAPHHTEGDYFWLASYGLPGSEMQGWSDVFTPEQRWEVTTYMRRVLAGLSEGEVVDHSAHEQTASSPTIAPATTQPTLQELSLKEEFNSLVDGLKYTPEGSVWARFVNIKLVNGTFFEEYAGTRIEPDSFYGVKIVGMFSADYPDGSWIELHDVGYEGSNFLPRNSLEMMNVVTTRPLIYGHRKNVNFVLDLMNNPAGKRSAYDTFKPLIDSMNETAAMSEVFLINAPYSDMRYSSLNLVEGGLEMITAYRITDMSALDMERYEGLKDTSTERGFSEFEITQDGDIFITRLVSSNASLVIDLFDNKLL